jgi:superfamily II DNA helicase RecQ
VVVAFIQGRDVFAILPTGYGATESSACNLLNEGEHCAIVVVVTPLTAIMKDKVMLVTVLILS